MASIPLQPTKADTGQLAGPLRPEARTAAPHDFDRSDVESIRADMLEGEQLYGTFGSGNGEIALLGITNRRVMLLDRTFGEQRVGLTSVPFRQVVSCSYVSPPQEPVAHATTIGIKIGRTMFEVECLDAAEAHDVHGLIMWHLIGL